MDNRFCSIFLPALVMTRGSCWLEKVTVGDLCRSYRMYNDYDADRDDVDWKRMRLRRARLGSRKAVVVDYREKEECFGVCSLVTYSDDDAQPVRCYTFSADTGLDSRGGGLLRENNCDMTSTRLQRYGFDISWRTVVGAVRIHERQNPLAERKQEDVFPDV